MENPRRDNVPPARPAGPAVPSNGSDPLSLQEHIRIVRDQRNAGPSRGKGKLVVGGGILALLIAAGIYIGRSLGFGLGAGTGAAGTGVLQIDSNSHYTPGRPLRITIDKDQYKVNGQVVDLNTIKEYVKQIPAGSGPAVEVTREKSSLVLTEQALKDAMEKANVSTFWTPPLE